MTIMDQCKLLSKDMRTCWHLTTDSDEMILKLHLFHKMCDTFRQGSKLTFLLGSTGAPNFKKLGAPQLF